MNKTRPIARHIAVAASLSVLAAFTACTSAPRNAAVDVQPGAPAYVASYGTVSGIDVVPVAQRTSGGGALLGAVIGGVLGHQVGGGSGRDAATVVGAVGGAVAGNQIEKRRKNDDEFFRVSVRLDSGQMQLFNYQRIDDLQVGDRVMVRDGQLYRG